MRNPVAVSSRLESSRVRDMQTCSPRFGRPGTGRAAAGLHFGLRASVSAPQYGNRAPVRPSTPYVGWYTFPTITSHIGFGTCNDLGSNPIAICNKIAKLLCNAHTTRSRKRRTREAINLVLSPAGAFDGPVKVILHQPERPERPNAERPNRDRVRRHGLGWDAWPMKLQYGRSAFGRLGRSG